MERLLYDLGAIVYEVAKEKGYLASKEQLLSEYETKYTVYLSVHKQQDFKKFKVDRMWNVRAGYVIDTREHAEEIANMFNEDENVQAKIKEYFGDK